MEHKNNKVTYHDIKYALLAFKKKAPKVPNYTCTDIDNIIMTLEHLHNGTKKLTKVRLDVLERKLERLRSSNEMLRDSGIYWYGICKKLLEQYESELSHKSKKNRN